ncbi:MAG: tRNA lysidine(34) synthetase TilS, partial [Bacteroidetes bacterium]
GDRVLLAVSGGVDSVVMSHLFQRSDFDCAIAHCNFQLRGEDSDADEAYVRDLSASLELPVYVKSFDVYETVLEKGISVQMAARDLRYAWFEELVLKHSFNAVATAHNSNDSAETFFINLTRGTGLRGLCGIPPRNGHIIRPLLFATRQEIEEYAAQNHLSHREDASNLETRYRRNLIRHQVIPALESLNPGFIGTMSGNMERLSGAYSVFREAVERIRGEIFEEGNGRYQVEIKRLRELSPIGTWLYELFSPFGFTRSQCEGIQRIMESEPGRQSLSTSHQLFKDRERLILLESPKSRFDRYYLDSPDKISSLPFPMDVEVTGREQLGRIPGDRNTACLDLDQIEFPLTVRHWLHGDYFYPLGMDQMKKLSDFFVDQKVPLPEKDRIWILASGNRIVWIMGHRIDHRFRITDSTTRVLVLRMDAGHS